MAYPYPGTKTSDGVFTPRLDIFFGLWAFSGAAVVVLTLAQTGTVSSRIRLLKQRQPGMLHGRAKDVARILKLCAIMLVIDFRVFFFSFYYFPFVSSLVGHQRQATCLVHHDRLLGQQLHDK